jgi:PKD repeat protein
LWRYDQTTDTWTQLANFTGPARWAAFGFSIAGKGYVGCGRDPNSSFNDNYEYDTSANSWTQKNTFGGAARRGVAAVSFNDRAYVGLGWDGATYYSDWYMYEPTTDTWTSKAAYPYGAINYPCAFKLGAVPYVGTGFDGTNYLSKFYKYDTASDVWTAITDFSGSGRYGCAAFTIGSYGYVGVGGTQTTTPYTDFYKYDSTNNTWIQTLDMPGGTRYCGSFSLGKRAYVLLGDSNNILPGKIWKYDTLNLQTSVNTTVTCPDAPFMVSYTATDTMYTGNEFTAELSDANGDFTTPEIIGTYQTNKSSDSFQVSIPSKMAAGTGYQIRLVGSDAHIIGMPSSNIELAAVPSTNITVTGLLTICSGKATTFQADSAVSNLTFQWLNNGTAIANATIAKYAATDSGSYSVAISNGNCADTSATYKLKVNPTPEALLTASNTSICQSSGNISFADISNVPANTNIIRSWDFGDNTTDTSSAPAHGYTQTGTYNVVLTVQTTVGCTDTESVNIVVHPKPVVDFTSSAAAACLGNNSFTFTNSSNVSSGSIASWAWAFGDNTTDTAKDPSHSYTTAGTFQISLVATTDQGCNDSRQRSVTLHPMPVASMTINNSTQCLSTNSFIFTNTSSISSGSIANFNLTFGDGGSDNQSPATHVYSSVGSFTTKLYVTSDKGCKDSSIQTVNVLNKPTTTVTPASLQFCPGASGVLHAAYDANYTYQWKKDGVAISGETKDSLIVSSVGNYSVVVGLNGGCSDSSAAVPVTNSTKSVIGSITGNATANQGNTSSYSVATISGATFVWQITGGTINSGQGSNTVNVTWKTAGTGSLTVYTQCSDTSTKTISIISGITHFTETPLVTIFPNPSTGIYNIDASAIKGAYIMNIYNPEGKLVYTANRSEAVSTLNIAELANGIYIMEIKNNNQHCRQLIIKE